MARRLAIFAVLSVILPGGTAIAAEVHIDVATEVRCERLLDEAVRLTIDAYRHDGATVAQAAAEAETMLPDRFFFWPAEYFLLYPGTADRVFADLRDRMNALAARSNLLGCGIGFHPVPES